MHWLVSKASRAQVTQHLLHTYWGSWCADTQTLLAQLPAALRQPDSSVAVTFERWLLELKVQPWQPATRCLSGVCSSACPEPVAVPVQRTVPSASATPSSAGVVCQAVRKPVFKHDTYSSLCCYGVRWPGVELPACLPWLPVGLLEDGLTKSNGLTKLQWIDQAARCRASGEWCCTASTAMQRHWSQCLLLLRSGTLCLPVQRNRTHP